MGNRAGATRVRGPGLNHAAYHPWNDAGDRHCDWVIKRVSLDGLQEVMCWRRKVILLEADRTKWERRSDLAHAIAHIDLAHRTIDDKTEGAAVRYAAKRLIRLDDAVTALVATMGMVTPETAELLGVDLATVEARLTHLHPAESAHIKRALAEVLACRSA